MLRLADAYVASHPHACFGHSRAWRAAVWSTYRLPTLVLAALDGDTVKGVAPWTVMLSPLAGSYAVIAPFASYGDLLGDDDVVADALLRESRRRLRWIGCGYAQVRTRWRQLDTGAARGRTDSSRFVTSRVVLAGGADHVWRSVLHPKTRNQLRKARRVGVKVERVASWSRFAEVCELGTHALGSPFHGRRFFRELAAGFGDRLQAWVALAPRGRPAAAVLAIRWRDTTHYVYGHNVHDPALRRSCANSLAVWTMIEQACRDGQRALDLGRSELGSPAERFKRKWGGTYEPLHETLALLWRRRLPDLNPTNPRLRALQRLWRALPRPLVRRLGPLLIRGIG